MAYGLKYYLNFYDYFDRYVEISILEDGYSGSTSALTGTGDPLVLKDEVDTLDDVYTGIVPRVAEISIICSSLSEFDEFFIGSDTKYQVTVEIDSVEDFKGYIIPDLSEKPIQTIYPLTIRAICGLGWLKKEEFKIGTTLYSDRRSMYYIIWKCLTFIEDDPIIYEAADIYNEAVDVSKSPFNLANIDTWKYRESKTEAWNCYDVLYDIMDGMLCSIKRYGGGWYIMPDDQNKDSITVREMSGSSGTIDDSTSFDPYVNITGASASKANLNVFINKSANLELLPQYSVVTVNQDLGYVNNLFRPEKQSDFVTHRSSNSPVSSSFSYDVENEVLFCKAQNTPTYADDWAEYEWGWFDVTALHSLDVQIKIKSVANEMGLRIMLYVEDTVGGRRHLDSSGEWTVSEKYIHIGTEATTVSVQSKPLLDYGGYLKLQFAVKTDDPVVGGIYEPCNAVIDISDSKIEIVKHISSYVFAKTSTYESTNNSENTFPYTKELTMGNTPESVNVRGLYLNALYEYDGTNYTDSDGWYSGKDINVGIGSFRNIIAHRIAIARRRPIYMISGTIKCHFNTLTMPVTLTKRFRIHSGEYHVRSSEWNIRMVETEDVGAAYLELEDGSGNLLLEDGNLLELN